SFGRAPRTSVRKSGLLYGSIGDNAKIGPIGPIRRIKPTSSRFFQMSSAISNVRPPPDDLLVTLAEYALNYSAPSGEALDTARWCLLDTLACGIMALQYPACTKLLGPVVAGTSIVNGARVPGTSYELDPVQAAFNIGTIVRWLDFNDTWLAAEWGHPSDNLGAILAVADWLSRHQATGTQPAAFQSKIENQKSKITMRDVLVAMVKAHEI